MNFEEEAELEFQLDDALNEIADKLFNKHITISEHDDYVLPRVDTMFTEPPWSVPVLQNIKKELNDVKNQLNDFQLNEWQCHTVRRNKAGNVPWYIRKVIDPEFVTQAWCKFYEIVSSYPLVPSHAIEDNCFVSVHLCEAPGAFVTSLNHWLKTNHPKVSWDWVATTLNPYYEGNPLSKMIDDDRFIRHTLDHWCFGTDNTGNLMTLPNLDNLISRAKTDYKVHLVTADGSIDCVDQPAEQETVVSHLHYCETIAALQLLSTGGSFLLKIFTTYEHHTVCLLYLLACCFTKVSITKPATSKEGNSETYVVCLGFKGHRIVWPYIEVLRNHYETESELAMFCERDIPLEFLNNIVKSASKFKEYQCQVILSNKVCYMQQDDSYPNSLHPHIMRLKHLVAKKFIKFYNLRRLECEEDAIVGKIYLAASTSTVKQRKLQVESFNERKMKKKLIDIAPHRRIKDLLQDMRKITMKNMTYRIHDIQLRDLPRKLWISSGKKFQIVTSSKFCDEKYLQINNTLWDIVRQNNVKIRFPSSENIQQIKMRLKEQPKCKCLLFKYTDIYTSQKVVLYFYEELKKLEEGDTLVLVGFSLLTQLNVGLLHLFANTFHTVRFDVSPEFGYLIVLTNFIKTRQVQRHLIELVDAADLAQSQEKTILSVYPVSNLFDSPFYNHIMEVNHWIIKLMVEQAADTLNNSLREF